MIGEKIPTKCCSLAQLQAWDFTKLEEIQEFIAKSKNESEQLADHTRGYGFLGERAYFCVTTEKEPNLEKNLQAAGFKHITSFARRYCYAPGQLKMWMISW